ncbi:MAG: hypothetical protein HZA15_15895 [Nitrospirae bacterium]|nr:hypothetical protein [Nitrospirota bacterium]
MKVYDLLWKKAEDEKTGKARWEKVGVLIEKDEGKMSVKIDLIPATNWDGWLVVSERKAREESAKEPMFSSELEPF